MYIHIYRYSKEVARFLRKIHSVPVMLTVGVAFVNCRQTAGGLFRKIKAK